MYSHDRTLLAKLGFSDPDKKDPFHDLACRYLALPENRAKIEFHLGMKPKKSYKEHIYLERPISKGEGQYKTVIGFLDVVYGYGETINIEVKITETLVSDILRQINLYRSFIPYNFVDWVVITRFSMSQSEIDMINSQGIYYFRLGEAFDKWVKLQENRESDEILEI